MKGWYKTFDISLEGVNKYVIEINKLVID